MNTIILEYDDSPEAITLIEYLRTLPFIREKREAKPAPACQFTIDELREQIRQSEQDFAAGRYITSAELKNRMAAW
jgi:hypothetical protein